MNKLLFVIPAALFLSGCSLFPSKNISGTDVQKALKLSQIIASGGKADCTVTNLADNSTTQITVSGKKMKFVGSEMGEGKKGTMINDTQYTYIWNEGEKTGIKTKIETSQPTGTKDSETSKNEDLDTAQKTAGYEDETKFKMTCTQRIINDSEFTPPADVKFTDLGEMMKAIPSIPSMPSIPARK